MIWLAQLKAPCVVKAASIFNSIRPPSWLLFRLARHAREKEKETPSPPVIWICKYLELGNVWRRVSIYNVDVAASNRLASSWWLITCWLDQFDEFQLIELVFGVWFRWQIDMGAVMEGAVSVASVVSDNKSGRKSTRRNSSAAEMRRREQWRRRRRRRRRRKGAVTSVDDFLGVRSGRLFIWRFIRFTHSIIEMVKGQ